MMKRDRKSTRLNSSHGSISYAVFCLKKKHTVDGDLGLPRAAAHMGDAHARRTNGGDGRRAEGEGRLTPRTGGHRALFFFFLRTRGPPRSPLLPPPAPFR